VVKTYAEMLRWKKDVEDLLDSAKDKIDVGDYGYAKDIIEMAKKRLNEVV